MRIKKKTLKSWDKKEISHLKKTLKKHKTKDFEHASYWMVIFVGVLAGIVAASAFATAGIVIPPFWLAILAAIVGLGLGNTFSAALSELDHLRNEDHIIFSGIIIFTSVLSFVFVSKLPFFFQLSKSFGVEQNPYAVAGSYVVFFLLPYYLRVFEEKHERLDHPLR